MITPQQMFMQLLYGRMSPAQNPMVQELIQLKQSGATPQAAMEQLSQRYPQFRQFQGQDPRQIDRAARETIRQSGMNPDAVIQQLSRMF